MRSVLITGGTGALGSALAERFMADSRVERLAIYARGEHRHVEMAASHGVNIRGDGSKLRMFVGDVRDRNRLTRAMLGVDTVIHAAALKHVPVGEYNPTEFVRTNVVGTVNAVQAAIDAGVRRFVMVSTDKACSPVNLYGATKFCAEKVVIAARAMSGDAVEFSVCRYGNVTGSTGSVIPLWRRQAAAGGPLTVTDSRMTRYWMTLGDACDFVTYVASCNHHGGVYVPNLKAYSVGDLVDALVEHDGLHGVEVEEVGTRDGEKMHEYMISSDESPWTYVDCEMGVSSIGKPEGGTSFEKAPPGYMMSSRTADRMSVRDLLQAMPS